MKAKQYQNSVGAASPTAPMLARSLHLETNAITAICARLHNASLSKQNLA